MNPDKDLTQKAPNATFSHVYFVFAGQAGPQFEQKMNRCKEMNFPWLWENTS